MNKQNLSSLPDEKKIEELLATIQPVPSEYFRQKMKRAVRHIEEDQSVVMKKFRPNITFAVIALALFIALFITPQGRAWAQEVIQYFKKINSNTIQLSDEQTKSMNDLLNQANQKYDLPLVPVFIPPVAPEMASISGCNISQTAQSYHCQVALAESKLGFDLKELPEKQKGWEFQYISYNIDSGSASISYELNIQRIGGGISYSSFMLIQGMGNPSKSAWFGNNPWDIVPADKVESVFIGTYQGEYVKGGFTSRLGNNTLTWSEADGRQRLAWSEGTHWYLIDFTPNLNIANTLSRDDLIHLAQSLVTSPPTIIEPLNPAYLTSISDAEKISRLDLKAPTLLPMNIDFSYAHYFRDKNEVHLVYGANEELDIQEWQGKPVEFKKPLGKYEFTCETVNMNGDEAFYCFFDRSNPRSFLWWRKDGLNYQMSYISYTGGKLDKEQMLLIAESMQDIDDFQKHSKKSYEEVALYAKALGIDLKKFSELPTEWKFSIFWAEPFTRCIGLMYASKTQNGPLFINQCKTNKSSTLSTFPPQSIERVMVGNAKGQYIAGGFVLTDNGKQIWDPTLPVKQVYWQADELWLQMTVSGESAALHTKESLISLAESLK